MKKKASLILFVLLAFLSSAMGQIKVSGTVKDLNGNLIPGVSVAQKGTTSGTTTDVDGKFTLKVTNENAVLQFSFVGMKTLMLPLNGKTYFEVVLENQSVGIDEVVVTAMGIKRSEKSLAYATQKLSGKELTAVPSSNFLGNLAGKTSGMQVSSSGSGVGSSVKIVLRGNRSIQGNNQPLYVVDGTPISSGNFSQTGAEGGYGGGVDAGGGLAGINPDDIESINVLKGATAAALYGSQASNGVIVITTKRGASDKTAVSFTSTIQTDIPYLTYKFQDRYTMGVDGKKNQTNDAWGAKRTNEDLSNSFVEDFFNTGVMYQNGISISGGNKTSQNFISYQNTSASGIVPKNEFTKHNFSLRNTSTFFNKFVEVDGSIALTKQDIDNAPAAPGQYFNPLVGLYLYPEGTSEFNKYKDTYEIPDPSRNGLMKQNWIHERDINKNPYWLVNRHIYTVGVDKVITKANVKFNFTDWLNLQIRGSYDKTNLLSERKVYSGIETIAGRGGRYNYETNSNTQAYGDVLLSLNKEINKFSVNATLGSSVNDTKLYVVNNDLGDLAIPNLFDLRNFVGKGNATNKKEHKQLQSVFGTVSLGYADVAYLDVTGRNDWSSTLPAKNRSYFYPSVGASLIFSQLLKNMNLNPEWLDFGKMRFSWTQVGNDMPWGLTEPADKINNGGIIEANTVKPFTDLKPERSTSIEGGLTLRILNNRLSFDMSAYQTNTKNQYFLVDNTSGSGFSKYYINAGEVRNRGMEFTLGFTPVKTNDFSWDGFVNLSFNTNKIISLPSQYKDNGFELSNAGFKFRLYEGEEWGLMYAKRLKRDSEGRIIVTKVIENGNEGSLQLSQSNSEEKIGSVNPKYMLGFKNEFTYKNVSLGLLVDGRVGGNVVSLTQNFLDGAGRSEVTADARDNEGVHITGVLNTVVKETGKADVTTSSNFDGKIDAQTYYKTAPIGEINVYKATNFRLRELSLSYMLPQSVVSKLKVVSGVRLSLVGRNLFFIYKDAPYDPDNILTTSGNGGSNADNFGLPTTRSIGFSLNVNF
ncbi:SusC/RagA family TonB-linked outer membrane protein [Acetobacteroides hydrogenigenes]|uniref:TonB-linked SusC/RagA family outer membrane protein n=1 Tax=Acetobacteroides hydrogenigenes TaxID=979970 RepID=A0A4R2EKG9_9BACT|nr:SusC/RagA family TonB-linked outer membrane protein [Acetobacteroides hydrogenigenes]TCN68875.1 TonB-linked SusC/RagA family outer membrane protein [Acetobacteroides hydrogenigenes]